MNIKEEIQVLLVRKKLSMTKLVEQMNEQGLDIGTIQNLSNKLGRGTVRFNEVESILDYLGYKINIEEKKLY